MTEHPETRNAPIIGAAVQSILLDQFRDELTHGTPEHGDGTNAQWMSMSNHWLERTKAANKAGGMTFTHLLLTQAYECAAKEDPAELRVALASLGGTVVQWIESLDRRYGGV